jgi:hypothetical protein
MIALIVLKLTGTITWSWWWVLSPIWIGGILGVLGIFGLIGYLRHQARRRVRVLLDMPRDQWQDWLVSRTENLGTAGVDPGFSDGEEQDPRPPD